jgi:hypothetical protein
MTNENEEIPLELSPLNFIQLRIPIHFYGENTLPAFNTKAGQRYKLPETSFLAGEQPFASLGIAWNYDGLVFRLESKKTVEKVLYPEIQEGDSLEIFLDTRDVKTTGFATRFCHHFFFLPESIDERFGGEITRFRTEDSHPICDHRELIIKPHANKAGYVLDIFLPNHCLYGYDPNEFHRLGFTYRINRPQDSPQHFSVLSDEYRIEDQPSLWSSLVLKHEDHPL